MTRCGWVRSWYVDLLSTPYYLSTQVLFHQPFPRASSSIDVDIDIMTGPPDSVTSLSIDIFGSPLHLRPEYREGVAALLKPFYNAYMPHSRAPQSTSHPFTFYPTLSMHPSMHSRITADFSEPQYLYSFFSSTRCFLLTLHYFFLHFPHLSSKRRSSKSK